MVKLSMDLYSTGFIGAQELNPTITRIRRESLLKIVRIKNKFWQGKCINSLVLVF